MSTKPVIIGVTSLARAGKDTLSAYLSSKYSFNSMNMSDVLRDELIRQGREPTKDNMSIIGDELRTKHGKDIVIKMLLDKATVYGKVVITGLRSPEEVIYLKQNSSYFVLVNIASPLVLRFERRNNLDPKTIEEFAARDERDIKNKGLDRVVAMSNYEIRNLDTLKEYHKEIDLFMEYAVKNKLLPKDCLK